MITEKSILRIFVWSSLVSLVVLLSGCKECKSSDECGVDKVCQNGICNDKPIDFSSDSDSETTDTADTNSESSSSDADTDTDTDTDADSDTASDTDTVKDTGSDSDTVPSQCLQDWECSDDNICTTEKCTDHQCVYSQTVPTPISCCSQVSDCDDGESCTTDVCNPAYQCENTYTVGDGVCCLSAADCNDGNACSIDICSLNGRCSHVADNKAGCCDKASDCGSSVCQVATCATYTCTWAPKNPLPSGCCRTAADCPASAGVCEVAVCSASSKCEYQVDPLAAEGCCVVDADCEDFNLCNTDFCAYDNTCAYPVPDVPQTGCCNKAADCNDGNSCNTDLCVDNNCTHGVPAVLPTGCCELAADCDDGNDCTLEICSGGRCYSAPDATGGPECCVDGADCDDGNACTEEYCEPLDSRCYYNPVTGTPPAGCCAQDADCAVPGNPCTVANCGLDPDWKCDNYDAPDNIACDDTSWCNGPEICLGGACVTKTDDVPCNGVSTTCRVRTCNEGSKSCELIAEHDTDVPCDDGLFCNGDDVCSNGDCIHVNPPCDGQMVDDCNLEGCDEAANVCADEPVLDYTSCENGDACDGENTCVAGTCVPGAACGTETDCLSYSCSEDIMTGEPICTPVLATDGTACASPDLGACFGSTGRKCLSGVCSIGTNPMCPTGGGFCFVEQCVDAWGATDGCFRDSSTTHFDVLACGESVEFSTALLQNRASDYGAACGGAGFAGSDQIFAVNLAFGQQITATLSSVQTTSGATPSVFILGEPCYSALSCVSSGAGAANWTATIAQTHYVVVDMAAAGAFASGTLSITCTPP